MSQRVTLDAALEFAATAAVAAMHTALPATVVSYDAATQTARVRPAIRGRRMLEDGTIEAYRQPDLPGVPVAFLSVGGGSVYSAPDPGDAGLLIFAERSLDEWKAEGNEDTTAQDVRRFSIADAIFLPLTTSAARKVGAAGVKASALVLAHDTEVLLGSSSASSAVALAPLVESLLGSIKTWQDTHTHSDPISGTTGPPVTQSPTISNTGASKVKGE